MKTSMLSRALILVLAGATAPAALAGQDNQQKFHLPEAAVVAGVKLDAGTYKVEWDGEGSDLRVSILKGKTVVVTTQAKVVDLKDKTQDDTAVMLPMKDGTSTLVEIRLRGKATGLSFGERATAVAEAGKAARPESKSGK